MGPDTRPAACQEALEVTAHTDGGLGVVLAELLGTGWCTSSTEVLLPAESQLSTLDEPKDDSCIPVKLIPSYNGACGFHWSNDRKP